MRRGQSLLSIMLIAALFMTVACSNTQQAAYTPKKAEMHGDVVAYEGSDSDSDQVSNLPKLLKFVAHVKDGKTDNVQLSIFNKGNNVTINQLNYNGKDIKFTINPLDSGKVKRRTCKGITAEDAGFFTLSGCSGGTGSVTILGVSAYTYKKAMLQVEN